MKKQPNVELAERYSRLTRGEDAHKCWHLYNRFHCDEEGCEVLIDDFVIFASVAEEIIELADFLRAHSECIVGDIYNHYSSLASSRQK
jgi:hypothetical protein